MTTQAPSTPQTPENAALKKLAVYTAAAGLSAWAIDMAATQVGLPVQQAALGISITASQWVLNIALMVLAGLVTVGGALGDRTGRLRMFRSGILLLIVGAGITFAGGGMISQFLVVLGGRALQGLGAALFLPASTALLLDVFPQAERGGAQGRMMVISMLVTAFAPTVVGAIIQVASWPFAYLLTIVAGLITLVLLSRVKYMQAKAQAAPFDKVGSVLVFLTVSLLTIGIMQAGADGLLSPAVLGPVILGLIVGAILIVLSLRKPNPLIQFRLMKIREVAVALFVSLMRFLPNILMGAFMARFAQQVMGISPTMTGLLMILPILAQVVAAPRAGKMLDQAGARRPVLLGLLMMVIGSVILAIGFPAQNIWIVLLGTILGGAGFAFINPVQMAALSVTPLEQRGTLAGIFPLASNFGTALWVALLTAGLGKLMERYLTETPGAAEAAAQASALGSLAWVGAISTLITFVVAFLFLRPRQQPQPQPAKAPAK